MGTVGKRVILERVLVLAGGLTALALFSGLGLADGRSADHIHHVLLLSVDGLHAQDLAIYIKSSWLFT